MVSGLKFTLLAVLVGGESCHFTAISSSSMTTVLMLDELIAVKRRFLILSVMPRTSGTQFAHNKLRDSTLSDAKNPVSLFHPGLVLYRAVTPGQTEGPTELR